MTANDVIQLARVYRNDPNSNGRWSNTALLMFTDRAQQNLTRDVEFPESRVGFTTNANQQEYTLPSIIRILRVYVNGQLVVPSDLQTLEGHQRQQYNQGFGTMPGVQTPGSGGPAGTTGSYTPSWNIQTPQSYPVANTWSLPAPDAQPWFAGQRPRYYLRGGRIGFVPAPAGTAAACVDCILPPGRVKNVSDVLIFDDSWLDAMVWNVVEQMCFSDNTDAAQQQFSVAHNMYEKYMRDIRAIVKGYDGDAPKMPKFLTQRSFFQKGNNRNPGPWIEYP